MAMMQEVTVCISAMPEIVTVFGMTAAMQVRRLAAGMAVATDR